jgi:hypothetical protein
MRMIPRCLLGVADRKLTLNDTFSTSWLPPSDIDELEKRLMHVDSANKQADV